MRIRDILLLLAVLSFTTASGQDATADALPPNTEAHPAPVPTSSATSRFFEAFIAAVTIILVSEIGDKTFFIAAIYAMRNPRAVVFSGAIAALAFMTFLSAALGMATTVLPRKYTFYASVILFSIFGLKLLKEAWEMKSDHAAEELEEVSQEIAKKEEDVQQDIEAGRKPRRVKQLFFTFFNPVFVQVFTLTFLAEWGDRSQISTIVLAAQRNPYAVALGGILGHAVCTGGAVIGGRLLAQQISVRTVTFIGAITFLLFALWPLYTGVPED